jgi:hypothetical protein
MFIGIAVGILIGILTGVATLVTLIPFFRARGTTIPASNGITAVVTQLLGLPLFWFGGPWLTTKMLQSVDFLEFVPPYIASLAVSYIGVLLYPLARWVLWLGRTMGDGGG